MNCAKHVVALLPAYIVGKPLRFIVLLRCPAVQLGKCGSTTHRASTAHIYLSEKNAPASISGAYGLIKISQKQYELLHCTTAVARKAPSSRHPQRSDLRANRIHHRSRRCRRNRLVTVVRPPTRSQRRYRWAHRPGCRQRDPHPGNFI